MPDKLIIVRTGNIPNPVLLKIFDENLELIKSMISRSNLIEITRTEIAEHG
jgi:predicted nuclease of predicted toxin-antitoxin system